MISTICRKGKQYKIYFILFIVLYGNTLVAGSFGFINQSTPTLKSLNNLSDSQISWISSLANLGLPLGSLLSSFGMNWKGRKFTALFFTCGIFIAGRVFYFIASLQDPSTKSYIIFILLCIGRVLEGMSHGACNCLSTIYAFELSLTEAQNKISSIMVSAFGFISIFLLYVLGGFVNWKVLNLYLLAIILPYAILVALFLPESPVFYIQKNKNKEAFQSILKLVENNMDRAQTHLDVLKHRFISNKTAIESCKISSFKNFCRKEVCQPFLIGVVTIFFYQFAGFNILSNFSETIVNSHNASVEMTAAGVVGVLTAVLFVKFMKRTTILILCSLHCAVMFFLLAAGMEYDFPKWVLIASLILFNFGFAAGSAAVCLPLIAEMQPNDLRPVATAILLALGGGFGFINTKTFLDLNELFNGKQQITFTLYGILNLLLSVWAYVVLRKYETVYSKPNDTNNT